MTLKGTKTWYESSTIRNSLAGILTNIGGVFTILYGKELPIEELMASYDALALLVASVVTLTFQVRSILGRIKATQSIE